MAVRLSADLSAPSRVLAVYAHPDDTDVACGGTLARWSATGGEIHVVLCALGDKGDRAGATPSDRLVHSRSAEVDRAAKLLGVAEIHRLGRPDGEFDNDLPLRRELVGLIRRLRPEVIVCPDPTAVFFGEHYYNHRDHRVVGHAALDAASPAAALPHYFPGPDPAWVVGTVYLSGSLEPNVLVDVGAVIERKVEAVLCHESQLYEPAEAVAELLRERAAEVGRPLGLGHAEAFRRIALTT